MTDGPLLELEDVSIRHAGAERDTPHDVSFTVRAGEVVLLLGPSGSGKSTLALALDGLVPHDVPASLTGTVRLAGLDTASTPVGRLAEHAAMVFQDPDAQIVTGTVLDEVCFAPENQLVPVAEVRERAERALRRVGLWERRGENPDRLSGGGRQRLAIACALAMEAPLLVLDEPTANLDPAGVEEVYAVLAGLAADEGRAIVLVEHSLDAAAAIVDRVIVLDAAGRLAFDGPAREVLAGRARELLTLGVWLPVSTLAAIRLVDAGVPIDPLPLTPAELAAALDAQPVLPALPGAAGGAGAASAPGDAAGSGASGDAAASAPGASGPSGDAAASAPGAVASTPAVAVRGLSVRRGGRRGREVVHDVSLDVPAGSFLAIVGANGAGKTSLLQAIAGVVPPPPGTVSVQGADPARTPPRELARRIGFVFQNPEHQFITHRVADELDHGLRIQGVDARTARVDAMLRRFGLEAERDRHPFLLSGGQKRRLSVGTALIAGAPVLALDEPTFGQDRQRAAELLDILTELNRAGTTVIVVTHDLQLVAEHATHIAVMQGGRLTAHGPAEEVLAGPAIVDAGLRPPPLARATRALARHPGWRAVTRMAQLPGRGATAAGSGSAAFAPGAPGAAPGAPAPAERGATASTPDPAGGAS
ncbi:ABC transporter ATP-binding protein [Agromyces archimandritae]|uniref:ABC transporter ATP-binding protein n=1 Tax=Agromyces archimandritae TaxID=2781962 RepID=A0A975IPJ7_9MICO|nr:ATP-binding cassette domain-containing protein [Agromyces archimandritae]QTX05708.1 ABC transporter ATP-binding protein [Agromyces archimandritae]